MKIKVYDNEETNCRELWVNDRIEIAVNVSELNEPSKFGYNDRFSMVVSFADWHPGTTHMDTELSDELV